MSENKEIRYILKFYYKKEKNVTQVAKKICDVYGHDTVSRVTQRVLGLVQTFSGNFDVKDAPHSGQSITGKVDEIMEKIEQNQYVMISVKNLTSIIWRRLDTKIS